MMGERLKMLRKKKGLSQKDVCDMLGLQLSSISMYESNKADMSDENKIILSKYFNVSLDYLMGLIDEQIVECNYSSQNYFKYPEDMTDEEIALINDFIDYIYHRRNKNIT